jgi:hypothetical protein
VFITVVPIIKLFAWGEGDSGGHVPRETTSRGLCGLVCPSRTRVFITAVPIMVLGCVYCSTLFLFITAVPNTKLCAWGE